MNSPTRLWEFSIALSSMLTVADTSAQPRICGQRDAAARKPSPSVGVSPLKRMTAQLTRAELQKTITK